MDINVFPNRSSTRDKETTKEVVDAINKYGLIPAAGQAEVWKRSYFLEFKVGRAHALARWAICKACITNKDYHLARVSRGGATAKDRGTSNVRTHGGAIWSRVRILTVTILTDHQPVVSRWVAVWHIAWTNYLPSSLSTRSLLISCAS